MLYAPGSEIREGIYDKNQIAAGVQARNAMSASYADYNEFKNAQNPRIADNANNSDTNIIGSFTKSLPDNIVALFNDAAGGEGVNVKNWIKAHANIVTLDADTAFGSGQRESFGETVISIPTKNGAIKYVLTTKGKESYAIPIMSWKEGVDPTAVSGAVKLGG